MLSILVLSSKPKHFTICLTLLNCPLNPCIVFETKTLHHLYVIAAYHVLVIGLVAWDCTKIPTACHSTSLKSLLIILLSFHSSNVKASSPGLDQGKADEGLHPEEDWGLEFRFPASDLVPCALGHETTC